VTCDNQGVFPSDSFGNLIRDIEGSIGAAGIDQDKRPSDYKEGLIKGMQDALYIVRMHAVKPILTDVGKPSQEITRTVYLDPTDWPERCLEIGFVYGRAPDDHWVECTQEQARELLRDILGVDVRFNPSPSFKDALVEGEPI
jgi:hypothetical protein